ncbi:MAG: molybdopterin-dependent oxidoreductase, partial [Firmicutes bacterium]|nr:molybdopterin-dependent oxidoreductase [Bacillota bacterium]
MSGATAVVGQAVRRKDAFRKVAGAARYTVDLALQGMAYGKLLRSPYAHARIRRIETGEALAMPGVLAVVTGHTFPTGLWGTHVVDEPVFPIDRVRFRGEPVAGVVALSEELAEEALSRIEVDYEPLPAAVDILAAIAPDAPLVHPELGRYERNSAVCRPVSGTNIVNRTVIRRGELDAGFAAADAVVEATYTTQAQEHVPLEPAAAVADWQRDGRVTIWTSTQCPFTVREQVARAIRVGVGQVRVVVPDVGGGFGAKGNMRLEAYAALLSRAAGRPVKLVHTRYEEFIGSSIGHAARITLRAGVRRDGRITAWHTQAWFDTGAYGESGEMVSWQAALGGVGPYRVENFLIESHCVYTNKVPAGPFRGMGWPQILWAVESHIDRLASAIGMDPLQLRLANAVREGDLSVTGEVLESVALEECLTEAAKAIGWDKPQAPGEGRGIACVMKSSVQNSTASAVAQLNEDGTLRLVISAAETGAGAPSAMAQIAAEALGTSYERVLVTAPDTDYTPFDRGAISDRTT